MTIRKNFTLLTALGAMVVLVVAAAPAWAQGTDSAAWKKLVAAAKAEGSIVISHFTDRGIVPIFKRFETEFGIKVEPSAGRPSSVIPKLLTEQKNGRFSWDVLVQPVNNVRLILEPAG